MMILATMIAMMMVIAMVIAMMAMAVVVMVVMALIENDEMAVMALKLVLQARAF